MLSLNSVSTNIETFILNRIQNRNMKLERVYREILYNILDLKRKDVFKQKQLSKECNLSISTVNYALKPLEKMNAIQKMPFGFKVINPKKILFYWASIRRLSKDITYETYVDEKVEKIEASVPSKSIFTAYSAFKFRYRKVPSEYSEVVIYGEKDEFEGRFDKENKKMKPNLIVLKLDEHLLKFKQTPIAQIYVDLWNLGTWYAEEFRKKLEETINGILE